VVKLDYNDLAREYAQYRSGNTAAVERLVAGSGISSASRAVENPVAAIYMTGWPKTLAAQSR
jgi:hypothetical protein